MRSIIKITTKEGFLLALEKSKVRINRFHKNGSNCLELVGTLRRSIRCWPFESSGPMIGGRISGTQHRKAAMQLNDLESTNTDDLHPISSIPNTLVAIGAEHI